MSDKFSSQPRMFHVTPFLTEGKPRHIFQNAETFEPSVAVSVYEQFLSRKQNSHFSTRKTLYRLVYLFSWALQENVDIEELLLNGQPLSPVQIRQFAHWLQNTGIISYKGDNLSGVTNYNEIIDTSFSIFRWFIMQYSPFEGESSLAYERRMNMINSLKESFYEQKKTTRKIPFAGDLTEEEIEAIGTFLNPTNRKGVPETVAVRDYLIWHLAIEFGLREGEILTLELQHCPHQKQNYFKIVRIEERGKDYYDPRGVHAPRPKTLSRDLGFIFTNSPLKKTLTDYITKHRIRRVKRNGKVVREPVLEHNFLIISYFRNNGMPLSSSGMQTLAKQISKGTGIAFHWHLARHAFFNRLYAGIIDHPELKDKLLDLVYWGGWSSEKSLQKYINRARRERAQTAIAFWQTGAYTWDALK